jgi:hypothetical protein
MKILIFIVIFFIAFKIINKKRRKKHRDDIFFQPKTLPSETERRKCIKAHLHKDIGSTKLLCPYCNYALSSFPKRKIICKQCKNPIFSVKRPFDSKQVLTTEKEKNILDSDKNNLKYYYWQEDFFEYEKKLKEIRNNGYTPASDVYWYKLQCKSLIAIANKNYQELKQIYFQRARELVRLNSYEDALKFFLQACYIGACGDSPDGFIWSKEILKKDEILHSSFRPEISFYFFGGGHICILNLELTEDNLIELFINTDFEKLPYPFEKSFFIPAIRHCYREVMKISEKSVK